MGIRTSKHFYDQGSPLVPGHQCRPAYLLPVLFASFFFHNRSAYQPEFLSCCRINLCICHFLMPPFRSASYPDIFYSPKLGHVSAAAGINFQKDIL